MIEELFSDAHPEYFEDDSDKSIADSQTENHNKEADSETTKDTIDGASDYDMQNYGTKALLFVLGVAFVLWLLNRKRRSTYDALKQDEKSTA